MFVEAYEYHLERNELEAREVAEKWLGRGESALSHSYKFAGWLVFSNAREVSERAIKLIQERGEAVEAIFVSGIPFLVEKRPKIVKEEHPSEEANFLAIKISGECMRNQGGVAGVAHSHMFAMPREDAEKIGNEAVRLLANRNISANSSIVNGIPIVWGWRN